MLRSTKRATLRNGHEEWERKKSRWVDGEVWRAREGGREAAGQRRSDWQQTAIFPLIGVFSLRRRASTRPQSHPPNPAQIARRWKTPSKHRAFLPVPRPPGTPAIAALQRLTANCLNASIVRLIICVCTSIFRGCSAGAPHNKLMQDSCSPEKIPSPSARHGGRNASSVRLQFFRVSDTS